MSAQSNTNTTTLTNEDCDVMRFRAAFHPHFAAAIHRDADSADFRAMLAREQSKADAAEHAEWREAADANRSAEGAWEDAGCRPASFI